MKPVIDKDGNIIDGLYRSEMGHLVINDEAAHTKYMKSKQAVEDVDNLKKQLSELASIVNIMKQQLEKNTY